MPPQPPSGKSGDWLAEYLQLLYSEVRQHDAEINDCRTCNSHTKQALSKCESRLATLEEKLRHLIKEKRAENKDPIARLGTFSTGLAVLVYLIGKGQGWW